MRLFHQGDHRLLLSLRHHLDFPLHLQNAVELVLLTSGQTTALYNGTRIQLKPGDLFIVFPNQVHGFEGSGDATGFVMIIPVHPYLSLCRSTLEHKLPETPVLKKDQWAHTGLDVLLDMACSEWKAASSTLQQGYALTVMGKLLPLLRLTDTGPGCVDALQNALIFINEHYKEPLTRKQLAQAVGYNESYISHVFSEALHTTLTDYITGLRVSDAAVLLQGSSLTVSQIAALTGFSSIRTFNRAFLKLMGLTPTTYRGHVKQK